MKDFSITKELKKAVFKFIEDTGSLSYGGIIEEDVFRLFYPYKDDETYVFFLLNMRDYLESRGWPCKIVNQKSIKILESNQIHAHGNKWQKNQVKRFKKKEHALSNVHFDQVDREDIAKIMHETMKISQTLKALKSTLNKYLD